MNAQEDQEQLSGAARRLAAVLAVIGFVAVLVLGEYLGYTVASGVLGDDPGPEEWVFVAGLGLVGVGFALLLLSSLARVLRGLAVLRPARRTLRVDGIAVGVLFVTVGILSMVGLGIVEIVTSALPLSGKIVVVAVFLACALIPLAPAYEFWQRRRKARVQEREALAEVAG